MSDEIIINERVDNLLKEMEEIFKESAEKRKPIQEKLDKEVTALMDEFDKNEDIMRFEKLKAIADYMTLTFSMPLEDSTKEKIVEELVKGCEEDGICAKEV